MKQIDIIKTINEMLFFNDRSNCYFESANEKNSHGNAKIYIKKGNIIQQHLKKEKTARLTTNVKNAILCGIRFYLYPDLQTVDPADNKKTYSKIMIEPYEFVNRCVAVLMTLFDYNLVMLKIKKGEKNIIGKINRVYNIIEELLLIFENESEIEDAIINKVFLKVISSLTNDIDEELTYIFQFNQIWSFHEYTAKLFSYYEFCNGNIAFTASSKIEINVGKQIEINAEKSYQELFRLTKILNEIERINFEHEREDLITEGYITSDDIIENIYDIVRIRMEGKERIFYSYSRCEMDIIDYITAKIVYNNRYKKSKKSNNCNATEYELLKEAYRILEKRIKNIPPRLSVSYNKFAKKMKFCINYLSFYTAIFHQFGFSVFNSNANRNKNNDKEYVPILDVKKVNELKEKEEKIIKLYGKLKGYIPFNTHNQRD